METYDLGGKLTMECTLVVTYYRQRATELGEKIKESYDRQQVRDRRMQTYAQPSQTSSHVYHDGTAKGNSFASIFDLKGMLISGV
jgi:hypothetical protein